LARGRQFDRNTDGNLALGLEAARFQAANRSCGGDATGAVAIDA